MSLWTTVRTRESHDDITRVTDPSGRRKDGRRGGVNDSYDPISVYIAQAHIHIHMYIYIYITYVYGGLV